MLGVGLRRVGAFVGRDLHGERPVQVVRAAQAMPQIFRDKLTEILQARGPVIAKE